MCPCGCGSWRGSTPSQTPWKHVYIKVSSLGLLSLTPGSARSSPQKNKKVPTSLWTCSVFLVSNACTVCNTGVALWHAKWAATSIAFKSSTTHQHASILHSSGCGVAQLLKSGRAKKNVVNTSQGSAFVAPPWGCDRVSRLLGPKQAARLTP